MSVLGAPVEKLLYFGVTDAGCYNVTRGNMGIDI
jgi:hypothetical protein